MYISRVVIRNFRNFKDLDVSLDEQVTCIIGENNVGKTNLMHAIRLAIDANLSSSHRCLSEQDFHAGINIAEPNQVVVSLAFTDFKDNVNASALVGCYQTEEDVAYIHYRFRPKEMIIEKYEEGEQVRLTIDDYHWSITGGGDVDPVDVEWNEPLGRSIRFADLQAFQVIYLKALRDVQQELRNSRFSPLSRIIDSSDFSDEEKNDLVEILRNANTEIAQSDAFSETGDALSDAFDETIGQTYSMEVSLGMSDPSFASIARSISVLLSNDVMKDFDIYRNGLGLNNILYISMLIEYFERRISQAKTAGQLLLFEEPEAHIHPQLQRILYQTLENKEFQTILSTHSTHICSKADIESYVVLTDCGETHSLSISEIEHLSSGRKEDLTRYLDATKSALLFAKKVLLVEGPAEQFLIPPLVKEVMDIDLDGHGISVVPIYGKHFETYLALFGADSLPKKCAVVTDGDLNPSDGGEIFDDDFQECQPNTNDYSEYENDYVKIFSCTTTFEKAVTIPGTLSVFKEALDEFGANRVVSKIDEAIESIQEDAEDQAEKMEIAREKVLNSAKRFGKARFAQVSSKYLEYATDVPTYIKDAIEWLIE